MADLLTHVLAAYGVLTILSWQVESITRPWVVIGMCGGAIPDLVKTRIVLDPAIVQQAFDVPFLYAPVSALGGVLLVAGVIALAFGSEYRRRAYAYLVAGGVMSLVLDALRVHADGRAGHVLYPFMWWQPPTPSLYVSSDPRILGIALAAAGVVILIDRYRNQRSISRSNDH